MKFGWLFVGVFLLLKSFSAFAFDPIERGLEPLVKRSIIVRTTNLSGSERSAFRGLMSEHRIRLEGFSSGDSIESVRVYAWVDYRSQDTVGEGTLVRASDGSLALEVRLPIWKEGTGSCGAPLARDLIVLQFVGQGSNWRLVNTFAEAQRSSDACGSGFSTRVRVSGCEPSLDSSCGSRR